MWTLKNSNPNAPLPAPAETLFAHPLFLSKERIEPCPSCPIMWDRNEPGLVA